MENIMPYKISLPDALSTNLISVVIKENNSWTEERKLWDINLVLDVKGTRIKLAGSEFEMFANLPFTKRSTRLMSARIRLT